MKISLALLAFFMCLNISAQRDKKITSKWFEGSSGMPSPEAGDYFTGKKDILLYCIFNDDKNIYLESKITESIAQNKILQMGLTLWINGDGKSRKVNGIRFPLGAKYSRGNRRGEAQQSSPLSSPSPLAAANTIELIGFKDITVKRFPSDNTDNVRGSVKYDSDGNLLYSLTIPLSKLTSVGKAAQDKTVPFTFAIEYGGLPPQTDRPTGQSGFTPSAAGARGSNIGRSGGGGGGGGARGGGGPPAGTTGGGLGQNAPESVIIWIRNITLAEKK